MTGKKRGRPPKTTTNEKPKFQYHLLKKPKYLIDKKPGSQISTPTASRASSPQDSEESRKSLSRLSQPKPRGRPSSSKKANTSKKASPAYHKSDYFYGSDFEDDNSENEKNDDSDASLDSDINDNESDSDFSLSSYSSLTGAQKTSVSPCTTPEPLWLQDRDLPILQLPDSSDDLLVPHEYVLKTLSIYEVLRRFHSLVRLSPFRFEDFCAAIICEEQSILLAELHIMLLKAILREEDSQQTHFGPLDQKDSVNISLYLLDNVTWPEILRSYVESDPFFDKSVLEILTTKEYPYTSIDDRLVVLQFLSDQFLTSTTVRDDMMREGPIHYDDHCRICHRLGDLLCCETCPAVFHLECVDPPLTDVPNEDWQCGLCKLHKIPGVADCVLAQEKQGVLCRQSSLGYDRHGRKYWFVCRRIFIETLDGSQMWYYSSIPQLELLLSKFDKEDMEEILYKNLTDFQEDIEKQMKITEDLTNKNKGSKKAHLELLNEKIKTVLEESKADPPEDDQTPESLNKTAEKIANDSTDSSEAEKSIQTRSKTGSLTPRTFSIDDLRRRSSSSVNNKKEDMEKEIELLSQAFKSPYFKLGMEGNFKSYVNQFNANPTALNKPQRNEDRDKKRHLSHKFSLTPASDFKWTGQQNGTVANVLTTLKQTLIAFEQNLSPQLMHPNWSKVKKLWLNALTAASTHEDIANLTIILQACLKHVLFANVWYEQLGHIKLYRITSAEREERKKIEKREKRERDDEEERFRLQYNFVKYTLGLKHQVWKQKGEEYRMHGQLGWLWASSSRKQWSRLKKPSPKENPGHIILPVTQNGISKILKVQPITHEYLSRVLTLSKPIQNEILENMKTLEIPSKFDYLNVSKALSSSARVFYPKIGRLSKLDSLLSRREKLRNLEEQNVTIIETDSKENLNEKQKQSTYVEQMLTAIVKSKGRVSETAESIAISGSKTALLKRIQLMKVRYTELQRLSKQYRCYLKSCNTITTISTSSSNSCYSPICLQRSKIKNEMLALLKKSHIGGALPKEIISIISGPSKELTNDNTIGESDTDANVTLVHDIKNAMITGIEINLESLVTDIIKEEAQTECEQSSLKSDEDLTNKSETLVNNVKDEVKQEDINDVKDNIKSNEDYLPPPIKMERSTRGTRGRPPKTPKNNTNGSVVEEPAEIKPEDLKYNRRFPKIILPAKPIKKEVKMEPEYYSDGHLKIFGSDNTKGKIYLEKIPLKKKQDKDKDNLILPIPPNFRAADGTPSILSLPMYEIMKLARTGGKNLANGFHIMAKTNTTVWPYQCPRPLFKTCWIYRTLTLNSYAAMALQIRILWTCLRWDDMGAKPTNIDGKHQITTETEIVSLELLKHRYIGRNMEKMQFLRRKVVIPLELPKIVRSEFTSTRLGLRKRKRADSPQHTEPQVSEEWIDEDKLELWEIKQYGEKQEKAKILPTTRTATGKLPPPKANDTPTSTNTPGNKVIIKSTPEEIKEKMEQQLRVQRAAHHQKRALELKQGENEATQTTKQYVQRKVIIKNADGSTKVINQTVAVAPQPQPVHQAQKPEQKVQIIRNPDGKITVRGLAPGQQLIQTADGKLHVVNTNPVQPKPAVQTTSTQQHAKTIIAAKPNVIAKPVIKPAPGSLNKILVSNPTIRPILDNATQQKKIIAPNLQQLLTPGSQQKIILNQGSIPQQKIILNPGTLTTQSGSPKQIIIQQPQGQQKIILSPGTKIVQAGTSTSQTLGQQIVIGGQRILLNPGQTILNTSSSMADNKPGVNTSIQHKTVKTVLSSPPQQVPQVSTSTPTKTQIVVPNQNLAQQISAGKVQIATVNGQQVLIRQTGNNQAVVVAHIKQQVDGPAQVVPVVQNVRQVEVSSSSANAPNVSNELIQQTIVPSSSGLPLNVEQTLLKGQPQGTVIKCVTAQVIQTQQGPRIVLQGLQGSDFTAQQSALVQQQVKQQLLKAQESNGKHGVLGPTKIYLAIQPQQVSTIPPPLTPVQNVTTIQVSRY